MSKAKSDALLLDRQLCFQLYLAAKSMVQLYQPLLAALDLTYPQYLVMLVLWEEREVSVKELGVRLRLDSGTLSPLLKRLEAKGLATRARDPDDERSVRITLTRQGERLRPQAECIPQALLSCLNTPREAASELLNSLKALNTNLAKSS
jgi:DNA-binding MarR family transcriptional regulator